MFNLLSSPQSYFLYATIHKQYYNVCINYACMHTTSHYHHCQYLNAKILLVLIFCSFKDFLGSNRIGSEPWSVCMCGISLVNSYSCAAYQVTWQMFVAGKCQSSLVFHLSWYRTCSSNQQIHCWYR